ncbi:PBECR4 domain-containing protein [Streptococcus suis]|uniref:PBECR4 domain-containing protein n=1 Tax=Streptococcus suis TaxID=1307 RepID=UPI00209B1944|nr:PBECR4 domain-containing protein [Streptococcus suis]MCO8188748.1 PBECR4 domain-containing protein [Streptococcus suis]HEM3500118.1 toprim domain-containing protein [Streptococcus suis]
MVEEHTQQPSSRGKSRRERVEYARSRDILDVANELNIELVQSGRDYRWKEHDSMVVSPKKNMWNWFSRHQGGDVIALVQTMKEVDFNQAIDFLNDGTFKEFTKVEHVQEPFSYYLAPYEQPFEAARSYLKDQRGLSDETIDFFFEKGVLAQANAKVNGSIEPVVVFKSLDFSGEIVGATLQGIEENWEKWPERGYAKNIVRNSDGIIGMHVDIGQPNRLIFAESAIDLMSYYELHRDNLQDVRLISMDGLKEAVVGRHVAQLQSEVSGRPLTWSHDQLAEGLQTAIDNGFFADGKHADWITLAVDNDEGGRNFIASLREKGATVTEDLPLLKEGQVKTDWNDALKQPPIDNSRLGQARRKLDRLNQEFSDATEAVYGHAAQTNGQPMNDKRGGNGISGVDLKQYLDNPEFSLKSYAETGDIGLQEKEKAQEGQSEQNKKERTDVSKGSLQPEAEGSAIPVPSDGTFGPAVTSHPTLSSRYLKFTIDNGYVSNVRDGYHVISQRELDKLNNFAPSIQEMANWYRDNLASSDILYVVQNGAETDIVRLTFEEKNFSHLTGIQPVEKNHSSAKTLHDFAEGIGHYNNILLANQNNTFKKLGVLPNLKAVLNPVSFYFDDLEEIKRFRRMDVSRAIKSDDEDILLAFRTVDGTSYPATLLKVKGGVKADIDSVEGKTILGIYRERAGQIEQIAVNEELVKDNGKEMFEVLKNQEYEEPDQDIAIEEAQQIVDIDSDGDGYTDQVEIAFGTDPFDSRDHLGKAREVSTEQFTQVLDAVYNVGAPESLERIPEELHAAWNRYFSYAEEHGDDLGKIIAAADGDQLLVKTSNLYQEWHQDQIYQNDYHVRLQWVEEWPEGPQIPFKETELVAYQTFIETLYEQNQAFYKRHQDSMAIVNETGNQEAYIPFTKVKFDIYAPGGTLIKSDVSYDIGDETEPVSRLLGLGYRRLEGQPQLAAIDKQVLSQLENQEVNQEISTEANEQSLKATEIISDESGHSRGNFHSPNEAMKVGLAQRVEEIMAEDAAKILVSPIPQIQESLSFEGNLIGTSQLDGRMLYINREDFGQDYHLELAVHSPMMIEQLSDTQAPWTLALIKGDEPLGYVAYGSDWGNDFQIEEELEKFAEQIGSERVPEGLYKQEEVDTFLATSQTNENTQKESKPATSDEPFDYSSATAYEISEHAFQKIREYTKSPEDMLEYMDFMSKFPQLSPRNVALIHDQWRGANVVATYDQWQAMGDVLGIMPEDVIQTKAVYTNKRTGETKEVLHQGLSVKTGEKSQITLFRPLMVKMIPVLDENGLQVKNDKGNPKYKKFSEASAQEKALVKEGKIPVRQFQERDPKTGQARFTTYKVFELSQTTLKPESYPKAMPNRHYNFNVDKVKTKEVLEGLCDYAESIGVKMMKDETRVLGNAKGAFFPGEQLILINPDNTPGEKIATTIHELAHATLHNPKLAEQYKENLPKGQKELEAEMTSHLLSKHFGLDTSEKAIDYIASWTKNLTVLDDKQLADSLKRIHKTVSTMLKQVETRTKPYQVGKMRGQAPNFPKAQVKGPSR